MLNIGDKVICIDDSMSSDILELINNSKYPINWIKEGMIYTIRNILNNDDIAYGVLLNEITNPHFHIPLLGRQQELAFAIFRVRKIEESEIKETIEKEEEICT